MQINSELLGALVGGGIAIVVMGGSQICIFWSKQIERKNEFELRQRERLERIVIDLGVSLEWFQKIGSCRSIEEITSCPPPTEARQVVMLSRLYFPDLTESAGNYANSLLEYYHLVLDCFHPDIPASAGAQVIFKTKEDSRLNEVHKANLKSRLKFETEIDKVTQDYSHV